MPPPDSSALDDALIAVLQGDAALDALLPDGVWLDEAPPDLTRFAIVSLVESMDVPTFGRRATEQALYLVKAVVQAQGGGVAQQAAARIDGLLEDQPLTVPGYAWATTHRIARVQNTEVDDLDALIRWQHRGGRYRVQLGVV